MLMFTNLPGGIIYTKQLSDEAESNINCFIIHLKTPETYKTIKRSLPFCLFYLFYFCALLGSSCWPRQGLGTTESNNCFFGCKFDPKNLLLYAEHVMQQLKLCNKYQHRGQT